MATIKRNHARVDDTDIATDKSDPRFTHTAFTLAAAAMPVPDTVNAIVCAHLQRYRAGAVRLTA